MSLEEKARWHAAYAAQRKAHREAVGAELIRMRAALFKKLTEESCWHAASRLVWLTELHGRLRPQQPTLAQPSLSALVTSLNTLYQEQPFYRRWWWYLRYRWWRVRELTVASELLSQWSEGPLTKKQVLPLKRVLQQAQSQLSPWHWLSKMVKTIGEKMEQRVDLTQMPAILNPLERLWAKGRKQLKAYGEKGQLDADGAFSLSNPIGLLERLHLTEPKACEEQRLKLTEAAISQGKDGAFGWLGRHCPNADLIQKRELVYYRLLEDCMQQLQEQQKAYWECANDYQQQVGGSASAKALLEQLADRYDRWHQQMMRWLSLLREGLVCLAPDSPLRTIYRYLAHRVIELVEEADEATMNRVWGGALILLKDHLVAILAYTQNPATEAEVVADDEGMVLMRFIDEVSALRQWSLDENNPLHQALRVQRESLQEVQLAPLCLEGISKSTFAVPKKAQADKLHEVIRQYQQAQMEQQQQLMPTPATHSLRSEPLGKLHLTDDLLRDWLCTVDGPELQGIKEDFLQRLQELEQLNEAMRQAEDETAQEVIRKQIKACSNAYTIKYHPDKIRQHLNEEMATRMFIAFRDYLERALKGECFAAFTGPVYASDPYFEELVRVMEENLRIQQRIIQELDNLTQLYREQREEYQEQRKENQEQIRKLKELSQRVEALHKGIDEVMGPDEKEVSDEAILVESDEKAQPVGTFCQPYHPGFWEHPAAEAATVKEKPSTKRQSLL